MLVGNFNQEKALVGAFSVITNLRMDLRLKLYYLQQQQETATTYTRVPVLVFSLGLPGLGGTNAGPNNVEQIKCGSSVSSPATHCETPPDR